MVNGTFLYETSWLLIFARWAEKGLSLTSSSCEKPPDIGAEKLWVVENHARAELA